MLRRLRRPTTASQAASQFSRRERQIMDVLYLLGSATVAEIAGRLPTPPTATAVRTMLRNLERKRLVRHRLDGLKNVYSPVIPREEANRSILQHVVQTFFNGSRSQAMAALFDLPSPPTSEEIKALRTLIDQARKER